MKILASFVLFIAAIATASDTNQMAPIVVHYLESFPGPQAAKDIDTGIIYYVESDGRHMTAISPYGKILWHRDPFADAKMEFYRTDKPQIVDFTICKRKPSEDWTFVEQVLDKKGVSTFISLKFNSSQAGFMDITTGDFHMTGQL